MARKALIQKNLRRRKIIENKKAKRDMLRSKIKDKNISLEERFALEMQLASMPRYSAPAAYHNRCELTGRPRGYYRRFGLCRNKIRELAATGKLPGVIKASWG